MAQVDDFDDLDDLDSLEDLDSLDDLDDLGFDDPAPTAGAVVVPAAASGLGTMLRDLSEKRNFQQILQIAQTQNEAIQGDPEALAIVQSAQTKLESESYIQAFLKAANQAWESGKLEEMNSSLKKARSLDPEHPEVMRFTQLLSQAATQVAGSTAAAAPRRAVSPPATPPPVIAPPVIAAPPPSQPPESPEILTFDDDESPLTFGDEEPLDSEVSGSTEAQETSKEEDPDDFLLEDFSFDGTNDESPAASFDAESPAADSAADEDAEGGPRIAQLLAEGREIFDGGDYQAAIDVWSRIFLIDIDNAEASSLIEEARSKKAELERQTEEVFHEAVAQIENGSLEEAKESLRRVLELQENHSIAQDYLQQLEAGKVPTVAALATGDVADGGGDLEGIDLDGLTEQSPSMEAAVERDRVVVVKRTDRKLLMLGALVSVLVIGGGAFLASKWDDLFPSQADEPVAPGARQIDPIERATRMHEGGQTENAINFLERIQPEDANFENAQALVAQWKALVEAPPEEPTGPSEEQVQRWKTLVGSARDAFSSRRYIRAQKLFDRAGKILPLEARDQALKIESENNLAPLKPQLDRFRAGQYVDILPTLWRLREAEPGNRDVESLIVDSYYNLALTDLQRGDALSASDKMQEVMEVAPNNVDLRRLMLFARTYVDRPHDLLYRIYVKYLPSRS